MEVSCPRCKNAVRLGDVAEAGPLKVKCSNCGAKFEVSLKKKAKSNTSAAESPAPILQPEAAPVRHVDLPPLAETPAAAIADDSSASMDPQKILVVERYREEWNKHLDELERQRSEALLAGDAKHRAELRRHRTKNILLLAAYVAAFAALAFYLLHK